MCTVTLWIRRNWRFQYAPVTLFSYPHGFNRTGDRVSYRRNLLTKSASFPRPAGLIRDGKSFPRTPPPFKFGLPNCWPLFWSLLYQQRTSQILIGGEEKVIGLAPMFPYEYKSSRITFMGPSINADKMRPIIAPKVTRWCVNGVFQLSIDDERGKEGQSWWKLNDEKDERLSTRWNALVNKLRVRSIGN